MHKVAEAVSANVTIPLLHIADATAAQLHNKSIKNVGLLGTKFTMEQHFYKGRLTDKHGINVIVPNQADQDLVHHVIYNELCRGTINPTSKQQYLAIIERLHQQGAEAVILGCTEIALLVGQQDTSIPLFDTTAIHAQAAVECAIS
mgnify:CR=1 FL=1